MPPEALPNDVTLGEVYRRQLTTVDDLRMLREAVQVMPAAITAAIEAAMAPHFDGMRQAMALGDGSTLSEAFAADAVLRTYVDAEVRAIRQDMAATEKSVSTRLTTTEATVSVVKMIVFGAVGFILLAVLGALVATVIVNNSQ